MRRREFLSTGVAAICGTVSLARERLQAPGFRFPQQTTGPASEIADLQVIRVRKKGNTKRIKQYLTVKSDGGVVGIGLGLGISFGLSQFLPVRLSPFSVGLAFGVSVLTGIIFGVWPAKKAARLSPVEALRYE